MTAKSGERAAASTWTDDSSVDHMLVCSGDLNALSHVRELVAKFEVHGLGSKVIRDGEKGTIT